ncbi:GspH/FimT family pseudopilin [Stutzerimonas kunmingensis]|jgi:type IV fimbrial biogenesis protein FimU|uniref:GspH/FimT family pseudopilin n=1 Tax=Stutzerimonas kunmingensis TaxID=1211807 RepID=UPI003AB89C34
MSRRSDMHGFTLIELMIIVALLGIFATIAVPSFTQFINNNRTQSVNNEVLALLQYARSTAVSQRTTISVCPDDDVWSVKENGCNSTDTLRGMEVVGGASINASLEEIDFRHNGSSGTPVTILTCRQGDFVNGYTIKVASAGSIRTYPRGKSGAGDSDNMDGCGE